MNNINNGKTSATFGAIGLVAMFLYIVRFLFMKYAISWQSLLFIDYIFTFFFYSAWVFDSMGLVFGVMGLKPDNKRLAKAGILLSVFGLFEYFLFFYVLAKMFGTM